jgi:hypothetical protein
MLARLEKLLFAAGVLAFVFVAGVGVGHYKMFPFPAFADALAAVRDLRASWKVYLGWEPTKHLDRARSDRFGVVTYDKAKAYDGVTLMTGLFGNEVSLSLRAMDGTELHRWPAAYSQQFPDRSFVPADQIPTNDWDTHLHGALLHPDGSVIFNYDYLGLVKLDRCGSVIWRLPYRTHHSISEDANGHFWVSGRRTLDEGFKPRPPGLKANVPDDVILEVSPDGKLLREISILGAIYRSRYEGVLFPTGKPNANLEGDALHLNHVEALSPELAPAFPMFKAGDLLVSLRRLNLLMVIDPVTETVKWTQTGPWMRQHDPHFEASGKILVYDNRSMENYNHEAEGRPAMASRILEFDPRTEHTEVLYEGSREEPFYVFRMGKNQRLPNGNILVTEPDPGRAFELASGGEIVWEFINRYDDRRVAIIEQATRYPASYANFLKVGQACPASADRPTPAS